jgi:hypothetical protein
MELAQSTVMFMGHDPASPHRATVLGSGFIVGVADTVVVATASHIFTWWTDKLRPAPPHALRGLTGDCEDMKRRLQLVVQDNTIAAGVNPKGALSGLTLPIVGLAINSDPRDLDVGFRSIGYSVRAQPRQFPNLTHRCRRLSVRGTGRHGGIRRRWTSVFTVASYGDRAGEFEFVREESTGVALTTFRKRDGASGES